MLFDEIEKAHHDVFNVLLQVLDDGRLTDGQGRTVDFKNTIIIMTSNIGSPIIQEYLQRRHRPSVKDEAELERVVKLELKAHFRPEFLNRVDDIIIFHSLDEKHLARIVDIQLAAAGEAPGAAAAHARRGPLRPSSCSPRKASTRNSARARSSAPSRNACSTRWRRSCSLGEFKPGDRIKVVARDGELEFAKK